MLVTILFSEIVRSTFKAAEVGDARYRELLAAHQGRVRSQLARFRGVELRHGRGWIFRPVRRAGPRDPLRAGDSSGSA